MEYEKEDHALSALKEISNHDPLSNWGESVNCKRMRNKYFSKSMEEGKKKLPAVVSRKELSKDYDSAVYHDNRVRSYILLEKF